MALNFNARIEEDLTRIEFRDGIASIDIVNSKDTSIVKGTDNSIYFLIKENKLVYLGKTDRNRNHADKDFDRYILISAPPEIDKSYLEYFSNGIEEYYIGIIRYNICSK